MATSLHHTNLRFIGKVFEPYYLVLHKATPYEESKQFSLLQHGNAKHPHALPYFRQDPATVAAVDKKLQKGWSTEKVYINLTEESEILKNSKIINSRKYKKSVTT